MDTLNSYRFETIGRVMFGKYCYQVNRVLERMRCSDEFAYGGENDNLLSEAFISGWSVRRTIETILLLENVGLITVPRLKDL